MRSARSGIRIASVAYWDAFATDGVTRKLLGQVAAWRGLGADVRLFRLSTNKQAGDTEGLEGDVRTFTSVFGRVAATRALCSAVRRFAPDIVYLRYDLFVPPIPLLLRGLPLAVELNTLDRAEFRGRALRARAYNRVNRDVVLGAASGIVGVTHEIIADALRGRSGTPAAVVPNGIDPAGIPILPAPRNPGPRLCFLGSPGMRWHGIDKIVTLARLRPQWQFDVIGIGGAELGPQPPANVTAHGYLGRTEYTDILASADAAIGTLALHRKGMSEACPLKIPEYLLAGIPTMIGYRDTNFLDEDPWYLLRLPNTEDNVGTELERIDRWVHDIRGRRVPRMEVEPRVSMAAKELRRLSFLTDLISPHGSDDVDED